jgi:hypothetical protein
MTRDLDAFCGQQSREAGDGWLGQTFTDSYEYTQVAGIKEQPRASLTYVATLQHPSSPAEGLNAGTWYIPTGNANKKIHAQRTISG